MCSCCMYFFLLLALLLEDSTVDDCFERATCKNCLLPDRINFDIGVVYILVVQRQNVVFWPQTAMLTP